MKTSDKYEIVVNVSPQGDINAEVNGVKGASCSGLSAWLDTLGLVVTDRKKPEYNDRIIVQSCANKQQVRR